MPVVFDFGAFGNRKSQTAEDVAYLVAYQGNGVACAQCDGVGRAGEVDGVVGFGLLVELFAQRIDFFCCHLFQLIQPLADFAFVLGGNISEIVEELRYFPFFTQIFDAKIFQLFGF